MVLTYQALSKGGKVGELEINKTYLEGAHYVTEGKTYVHLVTVWCMM